MGMIRIPDPLLVRLRGAVLRRHGQLRGYLQQEAANAIESHIAALEGR